MRVRRRSRTRQGHRTDPGDDPKTILAAHSVRSVRREESIESAERIHFPVAAPDNERGSEGAEQRGGHRDGGGGGRLLWENICRARMNVAIASLKQRAAVDPLKRRRRRRPRLGVMTLFVFGGGETAVCGVSCRAL